MDSRKKRRSIKDKLKRDNKIKEEKEIQKKPEPVEVYAERGEIRPDLYEPELMKEAAAAYARYLKAKGIKPKEASFMNSEPINAGLKSEDEETFNEIKENEPVEVVPRKKKEKKKLTIEGILAAPIETHDRLQGKFDVLVTGLARDFVTEFHNIISIYKNSRRAIGRGIFVIGLICAIILVVFDNFTVYEYAYNGKVLGYVDDQEEVTDVLDITGDKLSELRGDDEEVKFEANENITFNLVDGKEKSTDNSDTVANKLVYMTDIETEAFGIYDGGKLVTIVKSRKSAEYLLEQAMDILSTPDKGMELVSAEFSNSIDIQPINVLLSSVQSNKKAMKQLTKGGNAEFYHIVEEGESSASLEATFGVTAAQIYDGENEEIAVDFEQGDKVCIRKEIAPVSIRMVETGKMRETIEYETIKKDSKDYYKGDTHIEQEGINGIQIFEGTVTKVNGEVVDRQTDSIEVIRKKQDKIILIGTAERPKTAPTGTFIIPTENYTISSYFGPRWGRLHTGIDFAGPVGTPLYASDGGTVTRAGYFGGYGYCIDIDHENGRLTRYGHCNEMYVNVGDKVYQGQTIGTMGNTGRSTGPHLHFEIVLNGTYTDPAPILGL
ncbi:MAG TPA: peptidoglycan DD-metalloendopeptidase family protein [Mogibacterium sp.]|nr:peptidoglycan DD-metalloendopeptidase family protein [Mogibacterium sp.]